MFSQWFIQKKNDKKVGFEDVLYAIQNPHVCYLINVLPSNEQSCLITGSMPYENEEKEINDLLKNNKHDAIIIIYGKNSCDNKVEEKYKQLFDLGFSQLYIYYGGLFEWLLLQDIYGNDFVTTTPNLDLLKYRPRPLFQLPTIRN